VTAPLLPDEHDDDDVGYDGDQLILSDLVNRVLDRGVLLMGSVIISVADIDLVRLDLNLVLRAVETEMRARPRLVAPRDDDVSLLPRSERP
jgi:gas vesicle structural protein